MTNRVYYSEEAKQLARQRQVARIVGFTVLGAGIGAAVALLFAPGEGDELRGALSKAVEDGFEQGRKATRDALRQLEDEFPNLREKVDDVLERVT